MKNHVRYYSLAALLILPALSFAEPSEVSVRAIDVPKCNAPAAKVVFTEFKCKSADCSSGAGQQDLWQYRWWERSGNVSQPSYTGVGTGMTEMLATALTQTGTIATKNITERIAVKATDVSVK